MICLKEGSDYSEILNNTCGIFSTTYGPRKSL